jgi:hypothetical protein
MEFQQSVNVVRQAYPAWKAMSRVYGRAGELYLLNTLSCQRCGVIDWEEAEVNAPCYDITCRQCLQKVQIKCGKKSLKQLENMKNRGYFTIPSAKYEKCLLAKHSSVDYVYLFYSPTMLFEPKLFYQKHEVIRESDVWKRRLPMKNRPNYYLSDLYVHDWSEVV